MYKISFIFLLIPIFILVSCQNENKEFTIGSPVVPTGNSQVIQCDTFSINAYTVKSDSIPTSGYAIAPVGLYEPTNQYMDGYLGNDTVSSYFTVLPPTNLPVLNSLHRNLTITPTLAYYDSCVLVLRHSHYYYGDTTLPFTIQVHHLPRMLIPNPNYTGLRYNNSVLSQQDRDAPVIGSKVYYPWPSLNNNIYVRLDDNFGRDLFNKVDSADIRFTDLTQFPEYINSFLITPGNQPSAVLGFVEDTSQSPSIRIYYHGNAPANITGSYTPTSELTYRYFSFRVPHNSTSQFSRYTPDPPYPLNTLLHHYNQVSANLTNKLTYVQ